MFRTKKREHWKSKTPGQKVILDLCGGTGAWSRPYREAGYDVRVVTLPEHDVFNWNEYFDPHIFPSIYGILAAPDCAHFSFARNNAKTARSVPQAFRLVNRCRKIIEGCAIHGWLTFWAMENPRGILRRILGKPHLTYEAFQYGDPWKKATDIWGYFNVPKQKPWSKLPFEVDSGMINDGCKEIEIPADYNAPKGMCKKKIRRAITPPGFANAFFRANR